MSNGFTFLDSREISHRTYQMLSDFARRDDEVLGTVVAEKSFITNYASIDALHNVLLFVFYAVLAGYGDKSATLHDWLYSGYGVLRSDGTRYYPTRKECDQFLFRSLRDEGVARWRAYIFYAGARLFAQKNFEPRPLIFTPNEIEQPRLLVA